MHLGILLLLLFTLSLVSVHKNNLLVQKYYNISTIHAHSLRCPKIIKNEMMIDCKTFLKCNILNVSMRNLLLKLQFTSIWKRNIKLYAVN